MEIATSLLLLLTANGAPVVVAYLMGSKAAWRIDADRTFFDQQPVLGTSKTWRGIVAAVACCWVLALLLDYPGVLGLQFAAYAMLGDLLSSFIKRRSHIPPSTRMTGLDQAPEALLPLLFLRQELALGLAEITAVVMVFILLDEGLTRWLYRRRVR